MTNPDIKHNKSILHAAILESFKADICVCGLNSDTYINIYILVAETFKSCSGKRKFHRGILRRSLLNYRWYYYY